MKYLAVYILLLLAKFAASLSIDNHYQFKNSINNVTQCPPWTEYNNTKCNCKETLEKHQELQCNPDGKLSVIRCVCATFDNESNDITVGHCFENCENGYGKSEYLPLPFNVSQLNQFMCEERWNRTGRLCGQCLPGYSPLAYSYDMRCVKCPEGNRNIWKYILVAFGPLTVFYIVVLSCRTKATSLYLQGYLIFSQLFTTPLLSRAVTRNLNIHYHETLQKFLLAFKTIYSMWTLDFFRDAYPEICLDVSTLTVLALDYAVAIYPLLLTVLSYILIELHAKNFRPVVILWKPFGYIFSRFNGNWNSRTTVIDSFATFFQLSFVKMASVSIDLLVPVKTFNINNKNETWFVYMDASIEYFGVKHLLYAILGLASFLIFVLLPILLLLIYQFRWFQRLLSCLKLRHPLLQEVMESFQSCYTNGTQPGTKDYRWFSAVPFIGHYLILFMYALILESSFLPIAVSFLVLLMVLTVLVQPYKKQHSSFIRRDVVFWGISAISLCMDDSTMFDALKSAKLVHVSSIIQMIVIVFPALYFVSVCGYLMLKKVRKVKMFVARVKAWRQGYETMEYFEDFEAHRLYNPEQYNSS